MTILKGIRNVLEHFLFFIEKNKIFWVVINVLNLFQKFWNENEIWEVILEGICHVLEHWFSKVSKNEDLVHHFESFLQRS